jgi:hypothetical protein
LVPETERGGKPDRGSNSQTSAIEIPHQRLSEFRKLAEIPLPKFKERNADSERFMLDVVQVEVYNAECDT